MVAGIERLKQRLLGTHNQNAEQILIDQYYTLLQAEYHRVQIDGQPEHPDHHIHAEIQNLFNQDKTWETIYHIEQLLVYILREEDLDAKISRGLVDIKEVLEHRYAHYQNELNSPDSPNKRAILKSMVQDVQWFYKVRNVKYLYERQTRSRVTWIFIGALLLFFLPNLEPPLTDFLIEHAGGPRTYFIFVAITSGCLGATFSLLTGLRDKFNLSGLHDLRTMSRWSYGFLRVFIGMGAGVLFYYFIQTGLIQGEFVPKKFNVSALLPVKEEEVKRDMQTLIGTEDKQGNTEEQKITQSPPTDQGQIQGSFTRRNTVQADQSELNEQLEYKDLALLILLCFISGFSEKLVPDILARAEQRIRSQEGPPTSSPTLGA